MAFLLPLVQVTALLGQPEVERVLGRLASLISVPLLRMTLQGDLPRLIGAVLPLFESLLALAAKSKLPAPHMEAAFRQAATDALDAVLHAIQFHIQFHIILP